MKRISGAFILVAVIASPALVVAPAVAAGTSPHVAPHKLSCVATMSNAKPKLDTTDYVLVYTQPRTHVVAHVHFKNHTVQESSFTSKFGTSRMGVKVGQAAKGYKVKVVVDVAARGAKAQCSTSFTPG